MAHRSSLLLVLFAVGAHASTPEANDVTKVANQNQQYHQDRLRLETQTKVANQNQQYHQDRLRLETPTKEANQNQQYHQDRLRLETQTKEANQNQQYHQDRLRLETPTKEANQNQQYHQDRLKLETTKTANQNEEYHRRMLELLGTTKGKVADARLKGYLKTYLAQVDGKAASDHARRVVNFGGCMIQRLYWNGKYADAKQACAQAVPQVELAHLESCLSQDAASSRSCVTDSVKGEVNVIAGATNSPRVKFAESETGAAN